MRHEEARQIGQGTTTHRLVNSLHPFCDKQIGPPNKNKGQPVTKTRATQDKQINVDPDKT